MQRQIELTIDEQLSGKRADAAIAALLDDVSREQVKAWLKAGQLRLNDQLIAGKEKVYSGDSIRGEVTLQAVIYSKPQAIALDILFEDDEIIVINKPAGMVVHPGAGNGDHTLMNALLYHDKMLENLPRAGIVHRLDKDTSGIMMIAKTSRAYLSLIEQLKNRTAKRAYLALVLGELIAGGEIEANLGRSSSNRIKMAVTPNGKPALTRYLIETRYHGLTLLRCFLETGRTHQIRVHMTHKHHPLIGDKTYGKQGHVPKGLPEDLRQILRNFPRQALHAEKLSFMHPASGEMLEFGAPLASDFVELLDGIASLRC